MYARIVVLTPLLGMHSGAATEDDTASEGICVWYQNGMLCTFFLCKEGLLGLFAGLEVEGMVWSEYGWTRLSPAVCRNDSCCCSWAAGLAFKPWLYELVV